MRQYREQGSSSYEQDAWEPSGQGRWQYLRALSASFPQTPVEITPTPVIKAEPKEVNQFLNVPTGKKKEFAGRLASLYYINSSIDHYYTQGGKTTPESRAMHTR